MADKGTKGVIIDQNLTIKGQTTYLNVDTVTVSDPNIVLNVDGTTDASANGGGITLKGASDKTFNWVDATDNWTSNQDIDVVSSKAYKVNNVSVLNATTLGGAIVNSSLTNVGSLTALTMAGNILPDGNNTRDIGASGTKFANVHATTFTGNLVGTMTSPGSNTQVLFNNSGTISGDAGLTFNASTDVLTASGGFTFSAGGNLKIGAVTILADTAGSTALNNIDSIDATTRTTIFTGSNTSLISELTNLYFTNARAIAAVGQAVDSSASPTFSGLTLTGNATARSILPVTDNTYDLGSATLRWKDVFIGPGSLYVNGKKVIDDTSGSITISTDNNENLVFKTTGTGDIEITPDTTGVIQAKGTLQILTGKRITDSAGTNVQFGDDIHMNNNKISSVGAPVSTTDVATKTYVDTTEISVANARIAAAVGASVQAHNTKLDNFITLAQTSATQVALGEAPTEVFSVNGAVKFGNTVGTNAGTIRWTGGDFEGYTGSAWKSLTTGNAAAAVINSNVSTFTTNNTYNAVSFTEISGCTTTLAMTNNANPVFLTLALSFKLNADVSAATGSCMFEIRRCTGGAAYGAGTVIAQQVEDSRDAPGVIPQDITRTLNIVVSDSPGAASVIYRVGVKVYHTSDSVEINPTVDNASQFYSWEGTTVSNQANWNQAYTDTQAATSTNTASTIVKRDGSGNFAAGTITATATTAQYADLAERYHADNEYGIGSVVVFGGKNEITSSSKFADHRVAGVVSADPAYLMNATAGEPASKGKNITHPAVALRGKVPVMVVGKVNKGDLLVTSEIGTVAQSVRDRVSYGNAIFAKSIENNDSDAIKSVMCVII